MAGPFENVFYFRVRLRVTIVMIALLGVILIPSVRMILEFYDTVFAWVVWVPILSLVAIFTFLTVGMPLWMRAPVSFSYDQRGIEVVLSSSISRRPVLIPWERVIHIWGPFDRYDQYLVRYLPRGGVPQHRTTKGGETYYFSTDAKALAVTRSQLLEMKQYLPAQPQGEVERYLGAS